MAERKLSWPLVLGVLVLVLAAVLAFRPGLVTATLRFFWRFRVIAGLVLLLVLVLVLAARSRPR